MSVASLVLILFSSLLTAPASGARAVEFTTFSGDYLGQPRPGVKAVPFAPAFFGSGIYSSVCFSRDGSEAYWSSQSSIICSRRIGGKWTRPEAIRINSIPGNCPVLSHDDRRLYFVTWDETGGKICFVERTATGWSATRFLPEVINSTPHIHWNLSLDLAGNLYFATGRTNQDVQILCSPLRNGTYAKPEVIAELKDAFTICPYVAPDGSYLLFTKTELSGNGGHDKGIYIMFRKKAGGWTQPTSLTDVIGARGFCPSVTRDGKYIVFMEKGGMYWADASFIEGMRKQALGI